MKTKVRTYRRKSGVVKQHYRVIPQPFPRTKMFRLPLENAVYVPATQGVDKVIKKPEHRRRTKQVEDFLSKRLGGFTKVESGGEYYSSDKKKMVREPVNKVTSFAEKEKFDKHKEEIKEFLEKKGREWGQESMGFEHEGDLFYLDTTKKVKKK